MIRFVAALILLALVGRAPAAQAPANDACPSPTRVTRLPFQSVADVSSATHEANEPPVTCGTGGALWYQYVPAANGRICITTPFDLELGQQCAGVAAYACCSGCAVIGRCRDTCDGPVFLDVTVGTAVLIGLAGDGPPGAVLPPVPFSILDANADTDGDGIKDCSDLCPGANDKLDSDGDRIPDCLDPCPFVRNDVDSDGDGVSDCFDRCSGADDTLDTDGDSVPDCLDRCPGRDDTVDLDRDAVPDCRDNCLLLPNRGQEDADGDGIGDACEAGSRTLFTVTRTLQKDSPAAGDQFGFAVALTDSGSLIGAPFEDVGELRDAGAAYLFAGAPGTPPTVLRKLQPAAGDRLGSAVGFPSGFFDFPAAGAPRDDTGAEDAGVVYGTLAGLPVAEPNPNPQRGAQFGFALAANADVFVAGAPGDSTDGPNAGAATLGRVGFFGVELTPLHSPQPGPGAEFGSAVAVGNVSGTPFGGGADARIAVGAPFDGAAAPNAGAVHVFNGDGVALFSLRKPGAAAGDLFGAAVAIVGGNVLVGVPFDDVPGPDAGAAYLFDGSSGGLIGRLQKESPAAGDLFGASVAGVGSFLLVGAPGDDTGAANAGAVYLFDGTPGRATFGRLVQTFRNPSPGMDARFGFSIAFANLADGLAFVVGTPGDDRGAPDAGVAYLFRYCGDACVAACGNGIIEDGETCDDANLVDGDGCDSNCTPTGCGNGIVTAGEACDGGPGCSSSCIPTTCGVGASPVTVSRATQEGCVEFCSCGSDEGRCCDDGDACTVGDSCSFGFCRGVPANCDDGIACTHDGCDPALGCQHLPVDAECTGGGRCTKGTCDMHLGCVYSPVPGCCRSDDECSDGNSCDGKETCRGCVGCEYHEFPCCGKQSTCLPGKPLTDGTPCSDGNVCTDGDRCRAKVCVGGPATTCDDGDACTDDACQPPTAGCSHTLRPLCRLCRDGCDDGNPCNGVETCDGLFCTAADPPTCDDHQPCTADECAPPQGCVHRVIKGGPYQCSLFEALASVECEQVTLRGSLQSQFDQATRLLEQAEQVAGRARKPLLRRVGKRLKVCRSGIARVPRPCSGALRTAVDRLRARARELAR